MGAWKWGGSCIFHALHVCVTRQPFYVCPIFANVVIMLTLIAHCTFEVLKIATLWKSIELPIYFMYL